MHGRDGRLPGSAQVELDFAFRRSAFLGGVGLGGYAAAPPSVSNR